MNALRVHHITERFALLDSLSICIYSFSYSLLNKLRNTKITVFARMYKLSAEDKYK